MDNLKPESIENEPGQPEDGEPSLLDIAGDLDEGGEENLPELDENGDPIEPEAKPEGEDDAWRARKTKITVDGEEVEVTVDEALKGYMRQQDYTRKTMEASTQLTQAQALKTQVEQEVGNRLNQLDVLSAALYQELVGDQKELAQLIESNPQEYLRRQAQMAQKSALISQIAQKRQEVQSQAVNEQAHAQAELLEKSNKMLASVIPEWKDPAKRASMQQDIAKALIDVGYSRNELNALVDHRALLIARKAALWDKSQALAAKKSTTTRTPGKTVKPGTAGHSDNAAISNAAERFKRNPNSLDALAGYAMAKGGI